MPSPLDLKANDLGVLAVPPASENDPRAVLAEESALDIKIRIAREWDANSAFRSRGWKSAPVITVTPPRQLAITGDAVLAKYPGVLSLNSSILIPGLSSTSSVVKQDDLLYLVALTAEVGAAQETILGQLSFQYRVPQTNPPQIEATTKENSRRLRAFWLIVLSSEPLTSAQLTNGLTLAENGDRRLTIAEVGNTGFTLGSLRLYAKDPNWVAAKTYTILPDSIETLELCRVRRLQNFADRGFTAGNNGEEPLTVDYNITTVAPLIAQQSIEDRVRHRLNQIFAGIANRGTVYARTTQNLTAGAVAGNPGNSGESAGSPNGSVCLANDQRVSFTNQAVTQMLGVQIIPSAGNDGNGNALLTASLNTNAPSGSYFSENAADHKIYRTDGVEVSASGNYQNLGGSGSLIWTGDSNAGITPGQTAYFVPAIKYPAGSGFSVAFTLAEQAWVNGASISPANIRDGYSSDLVSYADPANNENYIVILGKERAALHYIYKKVSITTDANGVALIPGNERGCFAFIQGVTGRIDAPVKAGLVPSTTYPALVYYPPRSLESWQFRFKYPEYQGTGEASFLDGATVVSYPLFFIHTQGSGGRVFQGDASFRYAPVAMHLPAVSSGIPAYRMYLPCQLMGETYPGPVTLREISLLPGVGLALPSPGQVLSFVPGAISQPRSLKGRLLANGQLLGFRSPLLSNTAEFQAVIAFAVEKSGDRRMVVITRNTAGNESIAADSDLNTAIDTFRI